jgi:hypothetical protein
MVSKMADPGERRAPVKDAPVIDALRKAAPIRKSSLIDEGSCLRWKAKALCGFATST